MATPNNPKAANAGAPASAEAAWRQMEALPCKLSVEIPVPTFTVRKLMELEAGAIVETQSASSADVPLRINSQLIGWAEFEVVADHLAVRFTELA
jgi:flagellar motor switch/type III secretory pathway protein FliN